MPKTANRRTAKVASRPSRPRKNVPTRNPPKPAEELTDFTIVGVGASAGGLEAFAALLRQVPADADLAIVFVQHLSPHHPSALVKLLAAYTALPVRQVTDGLRLQRGHVYVIPPNARLLISGRHLYLGPRPDDKSQYTPVDAFF